MGLKPAMRQALSLTLLAWVLGACAQEQAAQATAVEAEQALDTADSRYGFERPSRDGIGKIYMGREISHVMGHLGAGWLERPEREREERTDLLVENLPLAPDDVIADIGAGTGYFSFRMAQRVPEGKVLAVDIQPEMLDIIEARKAETGLGNVTAVLGNERDPGLAECSVDLALLVDAYHEFSYPFEMGRAIARALKPGGKLVLIEYRGEDPRVPIKRLHKMTEQQSQTEMQAAGLSWVETLDVLPQQHFMVFQRDEACAAGGAAES